MIRVPFETMQQTVARALIKAGMNEKDANTCARIHTESSCDGIYSHGLNRVPRFVDYLQRGWVKKDAKASLVKQIGVIEIFDGNQGPGILNALQAADRAMELAGNYGVGIVALRNTTHWMRGGSYGWYAADNGYIAISWTNTESVMPAWGGKNVRIGNNPFVMAVPRQKGNIVLDMAMSQYSYGRLQTTRLKGEQLPYPGGFDAQGNLTAEPGPIEESMRVLPIGYWKGAGFSILLDTLAAVLSEGLATCDIDKVQMGSCTGCSQVFILIDPTQLGGKEFTNQVADNVAAYVQSSEVDEKGSQARYPGESTLRIRKEHLENGIFADENIWAEVQALA